MKEIFVYADWKELNGDQLLGQLRVEHLKGNEIFSFKYSDDWLNKGSELNLDPDLKLFSGPQYLDGQKNNFGLFLDSSPDRWGRTLIKRREILLAKEEKRKVKPLFESDFLLSINDLTRMGALRFKTDPAGSFLEDNSLMPIPPIQSIRELEQATKHYEEENFFEKGKAAHWLSLLMTPGSSLGGARPKANLIDPDGQLWIAKFPSKNDAQDSGAWEFLVYQIAIECGIQMSDSNAAIYSQKHHTFLTKRFDRSIEKRTHFASAMTLLGYQDGHNHNDGGSYLELVELLEQFSTNATIDIQQLWKRIVFSVAISNTDDHLRNHGFVLVPGSGWRLSPAYDINPIPDGYGLSLNIDESSNQLSFELCMEVCSFFRWQEKEAKNYILSVIKKVKTWEARSKKLNIRRDEIEQMRLAFEKQDKFY